MQRAPRKLEMAIYKADASVPLHAELDVVLFLTPSGAFVTYSGDVHCA